MAVRQVIPTISEKFEWRKHAVLENGARVLYRLSRHDWEDVFGRYREARDSEIRHIEQNHSSKIVGHVVEVWVVRRVAHRYHDAMDTVVETTQRHSKRTFLYKGNHL